MKDLEKLEKLLHHWRTHNDEHAEVYREWAGKTSSLGREDLSTILSTLYSEAKKLDRLFKEAIGKVANR